MIRCLNVDDRVKVSTIQCDSDENNFIRAMYVADAGEGAYLTRRVANHYMIEIMMLSLTTAKNYSAMTQKLAILM